MSRVRGRLFLVLTIILAAALYAWTLELGARQKPTTKSPAFIGPIAADPMSWPNSQLEDGKDLYLSANYLFQNAKLRCQKVLMEYEADTLLPTLDEVLNAMNQTDIKGDAKAFVEVARKLLNPESDTDASVAQDVNARVERFIKDPRNTPRGHYASSDQLKRYFRAMQFLSKATFDVAINKEWFAQSMYMLFPFDAIEQIYSVLSDPANEALKERIDLIASFYTFLVGPPDLPTFRELLKDQPKLEQKGLLEYAKKKGLPRINKAMGLGVQFLGERFTPTQQVIDALSNKFLAHDPKVNRQKAFQILRFKNVLLGLSRGKDKVEGLAKQKGAEGYFQDSYYGLCLSAIKTMMDPIQGEYGLNGAAAALTALAEQTTLVTKQAALVVKSLPLANEPNNKPASIWVQAGIEKFLSQLRRAEKKLYEACGKQWDPQPYLLLSRASASGKPIKSDSEQGIVLTQFAGQLALDPTVVVDVFYYAVRNDKAFLQWAIGPFKVAYELPNKTKVTGMELVFFEGWHDQLVPGSKKPVTNEQWRQLFTKGQYKVMQSYIALKK